MLTMECNKDEAIRAKDIAVKKMKDNDFEGARTFAKKAQSLYPALENMTQLLTVCNVHCSSQNRLLSYEIDWYGILQMERLADESSVKKQYRRLALSLHPDKNQFPGAEAAFKLICEANTVLSDSSKKSLYDSKIRFTVRSAAVKESTHQVNKKSLFTNKYRAQNNSSKGFSSLNQHQAAQKKSSVERDGFWTSCPFCRLRYLYPREFVNKFLHCQKCSKPFTAYEETATFGAKLGHPGASAAPSTCRSSQPTAFQEKDASNRYEFKLNIPKGNAANFNGNLQAVTNRKSVREEPGIQMGNCERNGEVFYENPTIKESFKPENANRKRNRRQVLESSQSCDTSSGPDSENGTSSNVSKIPCEHGSGPSVFDNPRRSSRKRQEVIYTERGDDDTSLHNGSVAKNLPDNNEREQKDALDATEVQGDSDQASDSDGPMFDVPEPEFNNFDKDRDGSCIAVGQIWAFYDTDGMPRFYAKVKKVNKSPFKLSYTWLEADPKDEADKEWVAAELPVGCGTYKLGDSQAISSHQTLSHQMFWEKGKKRGSFCIYPREGEIWAVHKDWDTIWGSRPDNRDFKYEIVEVLSDFVACSGVKVCYLDKVRGFVSLFHRTSQSEPLLIAPRELFKFSHRVPCYKMTGFERVGVPEGSFELDPASISLDPKDLCCPEKTKIECRNSGVGFDELFVQSVKKNEKSAIPVKSTSLQGFVDLEIID